MITDQFSGEELFSLSPVMISSSHFSTLLAAMYVIKYDYFVILLFL